MSKTYWVYILASKKDGALYVGVTSDLPGRVWLHRTGAYGGHTKKYHIRRLVWYDEFAQVDDAIACEKRLKRWRRPWKDELIAKMNPEWIDLYDAMFREAPGQLQLATTNPGHPGRSEAESRGPEEGWNGEKVPDHGASRLSGMTGFAD